ncbi:uncharacterized protein [Venturia canescens]|uniref:uncharacterized protein n=1 Tax=Venturia canescens TaxID=32260 RepID=UPI001C9D0614|nr:uncharacterized protein LOC122409604 [Venturia canescens]
MFREGHYLEMIKVSESCLATAIITIKEKTVEYKKKKITTNKWLDLQDWTSLYSLIRKAIIRNHESKSRGRIDSTEHRKSTGHLEVKYKFETTDFPENENSLPTIKVSVTPARKSKKSSSDSKTKCESVEIKKKETTLSERENDRASIIQQLSENDSFLLDNYSLEEYVPPELPSATKVSANLDYVPSRKSMLLRMRAVEDSNKYTPTNRSRSSSGANVHNSEVNYIPNSIKSLGKVVHESYDPCAASNLSTDLSEAYVPSSKGVKTKIEEYQPDFASKTMKFDDSYVPSATSSAKKKESKKRHHKSHDSKSKKPSTSRSVISKIAKREL